MLQQSRKDASNEDNAEESNTVAVNARKKKKCISIPSVFPREYIINDLAESDNFPVWLYRTEASR